MNTSFHKLLLVTQAIFQKKLFAGLSDTDLTIGQPKILDYLSEHDGCVQKELAGGCGIEPATVTSVLLRMEQKGLIERRALSGDRRSLYVYTTLKGKQMQKRISEEFALLEEQAFRNFSEEEKEDFMKKYLRIYDNIR